MSNAKKANPEQGTVYFLEPAGGWKKNTKVRAHYLGEAIRKWVAILDPEELQILSEQRKVPYNDLSLRVWVTNKDPVRKQVALVGLFKIRPNLLDPRTGERNPDYWPVDPKRPDSY